MKRERGTEGFSDFFGVCDGQGALDRAGRRWTTAVRIILDHFHQFCHLAFLPGRPHHGMRLWLRGREIERARASERASLIQDFQEQKCSSAALVPLEIPSKPWPCAFFVQKGERKRRRRGRGGAHAGGADTRNRTRISHDLGARLGVMAGCRRAGTLAWDGR